jgi:acetolactate synthase-1/3 small subunit
VDDITHKPLIERELALIKVNAPQTRAEVLQLADVFRARVVDVDAATIVIEVTGTPASIGKFEMVLEPYGIVEMVRTGAVAMARGHELLSAAPPLAAPPRMITTLTPPASPCPSDLKTYHLNLKTQDNSHG